MAAGGLMPATYRPWLRPPSPAPSWRCPSGSRISSIPKKRNYASQTRCGLVAFWPFAPVLHHVCFLHPVTGLGQRFHDQEGFGDAPLGRLNRQLVVLVVR